MMKTYKILLKNKTICAYGLINAMEYARRESLVGGRVSVLDGEVKVATYFNGDPIYINY